VGYAPENDLSATQASVLVHETMHFDINKPQGIGEEGIRDNGYGYQSTTTLAENDPDAALRNPESYRLYVENTCVPPSLQIK
jgi:hypothetical protein